VPMTRGNLAGLSAKKKVIQWFADYKWPLTALIWVLTVTLGCIGWSKYLIATGQAGAFWDVCYNTLKLFNLTFVTLPVQLNVELQIARFLAPAIGLYTAAQGLVSLFPDQVQILKMRFMKNHTVICGLGLKGLLLSDNYKAIGERVLVIESDAKNTMIEHSKDQGVIVLIGNATDPQLLEKARVKHAKSVIAVCGNDGTNAEIALNVSQLVQRRERRALSCLVHIFDLQLWNLLKEYEILMGKLDTFRLSFFNIYESGARVLLYDYPPFKGDGQASNPHIVIVGIGRMGESLVLNAARSWRYSDNTAGGRLRITLIDKKAQSKMGLLYLRYPQLEKICEILPVEIDINSPEFERGGFLFDQNGHCDVDIIYICLGAETTALTAGLNLRECMKAFKIPVIVRMNLTSGLSTLLRGNQYKTFSNHYMHVFPLLERTCTPKVIWEGCTNEILARAIHEDYVKNAIKRGETLETNPSIVAWTDLPENLKESNRNQAEHISLKLKRFGYDFSMTRDWDIQLIEFSAAEVEEMGKMEHKRFIDERLREGWTYGAFKDEKKKISPTLIPWEKLSEEEKDKDRNTVKSIPFFLAKAGYKVNRLIM
jgi:hypothetical protein